MQTLVTNKGLELLSNASVTGSKVTLKYYALGFGDGVTADMEKLEGQFHKSEINSLTVDGDTINVDVMINKDKGKYNQIGILDDKNNLIVVSDHPTTELDGGIITTFDIKIKSNNAEVVEITTGNDDVFATRDYVTEVNEILTNNINEIGGELDALDDKLITSTQELEQEDERLKKLINENKNKTNENTHAINSLKSDVATNKESIAINKSDIGKLSNEQIKTKQRVEEVATDVQNTKNSLTDLTGGLHATNENVEQNKEYITNLTKDNLELWENQTKHSKLTAGSETLGHVYLTDDISSLDVSFHTAVTPKAVEDAINSIGEYVLSPATETTLGGVTIGDGLTVDEGHVTVNTATSEDVDNVTGNVYITPETLEYRFRDIEQTENEVKGGTAFGLYNDVRESSSIAAGLRNLVFNRNSSAIGRNNSAYGRDSHTIGQDNSALSDNTVAIGYMNKVNEPESYALGYTNEVDGEQSAAVGRANKIKARASFAFGRWNESIGEASCTVGTQNVAGEGSLSIGTKNTSAGHDSTAIGVDNSVYAVSSNAIVIGTKNTAKTSRAIAIGSNNEIDAEDASALGTANKVTGTFGSAQGYKNEASGEYSLSSGLENKADGAYSVARGKGTHVLGDHSTVVGKDIITNADHSHAYGVGLRNMTQFTHVIGQYNEIKGTVANSAPTEDSDVWVIGNGTSGEERNNVARIQHDGQMFIDGRYRSKGADYAEMFEWSDGNQDNEDRTGLAVTVAGDGKIKLANEGDEVIGVVSATPSVVGNDPDKWRGKYITDDFGRTVWMTEGDIRKPKLNPEYDSEQEYISRAKRKEWAAIGLLGQIRVVDDGSCEVGKRASVSKDGVFTAGDDYIVLDRVTDNIVTLLIK